LVSAIQSTINFTFTLSVTIKIIVLKKPLLVVLLIFSILVIDQALKIWIKTSFCYGEDRPLFGNAEWARLNFVENPGMAFGWKFGGEFGKLALSLFRLVAITFLIYYVVQLIKRKVNTGLLVSFSLILAGAIGNMIDSAFYGIIFSNSDFHCSEGPAKMFPQGGGYAGFLHGKVVDMLFFPLYHNKAGELIFFQPVFNIADSAITVGVLSILLFQRNYFSSVAEAGDTSKNAEIPIGNSGEVADTEGAGDTGDDEMNDEKKDV
jgi:signal peptidase II